MTMTPTTSDIAALLSLPASMSTHPGAALTTHPLAQSPLPQTISPGNGKTPHEVIRHILLGSPGAVRQTIHLLHSLRYAETVLWSPLQAVEDELVITPAQGEAMSLLRKQV